MTGTTATLAAHWRQVRTVVAGGELHHAAYDGHSSWKFADSTFWNAAADRLNAARGVK